MTEITLELNKIYTDTILKNPKKQFSNKEIEIYYITFYKDIKTHIVNRPCNTFIFNVDFSDRNNLKIFKKMLWDDGFYDISVVDGNILVISTKNWIYPKNTEIDPIVDEKESKGKGYTVYLNEPKVNHVGW